jgi:hypothetical protein
MTKTTKIIGLVVALVLVIIGAVTIFTPKKSVSPQPLQFAASPKPTTQVITVTPKAPEPTSKFSDAVRAQVRSSFITNCLNYYGKQYTTACNCAADYLRANYTDTQLETIYRQYHSSSSTPTAIKSAYDKCKDK